MKKYDFSGYATRNDILCADGRTIRKNAFVEDDGKEVSLVWRHLHDDPKNFIGHALLENRDDGVYAYCCLNNSERAKEVKELVEHGDIKSLSIFANQLKQKGSDVMHGIIREVSVCMAGANPGATIDTLAISHSEEDGEDCIISFDIPIALEHADDKEDPEPKEDSNENGDSEDDGETIGDIVKTMTEKQKKAMIALIGMVHQSYKNDNNKGDNDMKHNIFDANGSHANVLSHETVANIFADAKRLGSLKDAVLQHAEDFENALAHAEAEGPDGFGTLGYSRSVGEDGTVYTTPSYGVGNIGYLFPDARNLNNMPEMIKRDTGWVPKVMGGVHRSPFSRIKSLHADITEDEARAKGYIKGNYKREEIFGLLKRTTTPTTVYKKQKLDRDDLIDITDFDAVAWVKSEMRGMLDEELARAILVGDGRSAASDDKINEMNIRPIWTDHDFFTVKVPVATTSLGVIEDAEEASARAKLFIRNVIKARKNYKGSGSPTLFTTEDMLTDMLLIEDGMGRTLYDTEAKLATALRVKEIVTVEVMEGLTRMDGTVQYALAGIIVNLNDYNVGADKGGAVNMFDDFDIDYNQQKYLIETRCSGALTKFHSAMAIEFVTP